MINSANPHVIVIGGGPAGTTASTLIAQQGYRVELFEREKFPRYHIGESLIPETYWVLERLNMLEKLRNSPFIKKYSVQFVNDNGKLSAPFYFTQHKDHESSQTWQVLRSEFDQLMLNNAREHGVTAHEEVRVLDVLFEGDRAVGVQYMTKDGQTREMRADVIVDASGQSSLLINKLKLKVADPDLNKGSIWTYFKGAAREQGIDEGATIIMQLEGKKGWFWYIPLHNDIVSVGVVSDFDYLFKGRADHATTFQEEMDRCPAVKQKLAQAEQVDRFYATRDFTYKARQAAGDGWVLIGDAFGFLDPLYSSGVLLALKSGQLAADAITEGLAKGDTSKAQLGIWEHDYLIGMDRMRKLVCAYYENLNFGRFMRSYPHHKGDLTDLLIGDLFKDSLDNVFTSIEAWKTEDAEQMMA
ncbi:MAG: tryptophan 7-halogenase [Planctomycetaceae bacterium]|nr:tryptophan 7-halogenase [Planctomycetaceae bacterium]